MAIATATGRNNAASGYTGPAALVALTTTVPGASAGTEVTGSGYARKVPTWSAPVNGVSTATVTFDVPAGVTVRGAQVLTTGGVYIDGGAVTEQAFATAGTYTLTLTYTQS